MRKFFGKGVSPSIAIGKAVLHIKKDTEVERKKITDTASELLRLDKAVKSVSDSLSELYEKALGEVGESGAQIFEIHRMMLEDDDYMESVRGIIERQKVNAEYAVALTSDNFAAIFLSMEDNYMRGRAADVRDVSNRLISTLLGEAEDMENTDGGAIICARDLAPSETVSIDKDNVLAFLLAHGSENSHTAILARGMNIPAVIGIGNEALASISDGDTLIVNGSTGEVILNPDETQLFTAKRKKQEDAAAQTLLEKLRGKDNVTKDGHRVEVYANIGNSREVGAALLSDAGGIGLFRSEFIYLESKNYPTEEEQFSIYRRVLESMGGRKVIIRTLDIGADKKADYFGLENEENPALGFRAIRICLTRPNIFKTQLRALYRASAFGNLAIMFPMIISEIEVHEIFDICRQVREELNSEGVPVSDSVELGIMIETPAAAIISDKLAPMVDFFSIGTNDLTQYTLACDRQNPALDAFCDPHHEAVLRLIENTAKAAHRHGKWVGICGELGADTSLTKKFLQMGIDELSVSPSSVLPLRAEIRKINLSE